MIEGAYDPKDVALMAQDQDLKKLRQGLLEAIVKYRYSYNFTWLGRPIIQIPEDIISIQEIIFSVQPDLIIETGVAHGGSLILSASLLELIGSSTSKVIGIDVDIRAHNRLALENHPLFHRLHLIEGSSISPEVISEVREISADKSCVMIILDSNHTHEHVLQELRLYSPFVTHHSYLIVLDTVIEDLPENSFPDRPWDKGNNPKTAVWEFLKENDQFEIDKERENRLLFTVAPDGYLKRVR